MGSKSSTNQNQKTDMTEISQLLMDPEIKKQLGAGYSGLSNLFQQRVAAPLQLHQFNGFSSTPEALVQNMVSQGIQNINAKETAQNQGIANQVSQAGTGNNMALLAALQRRGQINAAGNQNALMPEAMRQQREFDMARQGLYQNDNAQKLAARGQLMQELGVGGQLLGQLQNLGVQTGKQVGNRKGTETTNSTTKSRSGIASLF